MVITAARNDISPKSAFDSRSGRWQRTLREYLRPWKLATLAAGLALLVMGSLHYRFQDWDIGISLVMGLLAYVFAPWTVRAFVERRWRLAPPALLAAWFTIDGVYVAYNELLGHWYVRDANFYASSCLYLLCGFVWLYRGSLRELCADVTKALRRVPTAPGSRREAP